MFFCLHRPDLSLFLFFFFNDTATTEIYTLSLHDALPILFFFLLFVALFVFRVFIIPRGRYRGVWYGGGRSEEHTSELQSQSNLVCRLLLEKKKITVLKDGRGERILLQRIDNTAERTSVCI